jgi:rhamnosyltransferase subunit B
VSRVLIATLGSLGDLNPALALGHALVAAGHEVCIAANPMHGAATRGQGFVFVPLGQHLDPTDLSNYVDINETHDECFSFIDHANFTQLDTLYDDLSAAAENADLLLAAYYVVPAHLVAAKRGIPLLAYTLSPAYFVEQTRMQGTHIGKPAPTGWHVALAMLRRRVGLPARLLPYTSIFTAPVRIFGLFPQFLLESDHQIPLQVVGYSQTTWLKPVATPDPALLAFCDERTVVFSFGTFVDCRDSQRMFEASVAACRTLSLKCMYLSRYIEWNDVLDDVLVRPFVDHAAIFPCAGIIVHHGGLGTLVAASAAGKPMVIVPFLYDQPYHARRMAALIGAPIVMAADYRHASLIEALRIATKHAQSMKHALAELMAREEDGFLRIISEVEALTDSVQCTTSLS